MTNLYSHVTEHIKAVRADIPDNVTLVCVSKFHPVEAIQIAYDAGERHFGESRVQELQQKRTRLPEDINWHFIGHLQTNKVRDLLKLKPYLIESVDSLKLLRTLQTEAEKAGIVQDILLEIHVAKEETKTGFSPEELDSLPVGEEWRERFPNLCCRGLMAMATNTNDETEIRRCFNLTATLAKERMHNPVISMGMSDDYAIAIGCGSTSVRIGSAVFGERDYSRTDKPELPKAVFFDQDGVLFNSMPFHAVAWEEAMREHGLTYSAMDCYKNEGRTGAGVIGELYQRMYGKDAPEELIETIYQDKANRFLQLTKGELPDTVDGVKELLDFLHQNGIQCWVVTGSGQKNLIGSLNKTFNNVFSGIISAYDVTHGKPDPEPYLKAWERSGFRKEECWVVENAPLGVRAAKAAGLYAIAVNTGILPDELLWDEHADKVFSDMHACLDWMKNG